MRLIADFIDVEGGRMRGEAVRMRRARFIDDNGRELPQMENVVAALEIDFQTIEAVELLSSRMAHVSEHRTLVWQGNCFSIDADTSGAYFRNEDTGEVTGPLALRALASVVQTWKVFLGQGKQVESESFDF